MKRIIVDTNVLISALISEGKPRALIREITNGRLALVLSEEMLKEFQDVLRRPKFEIPEKEIDNFVKTSIITSEMINAKSNFRIVKEDPDDDVVLNTAYDSAVEYIVTGDEHLLKLKEFKNIKIVTVSEMLNALK